MTREELEKVVQGTEYNFLRENPHLGNNIMFLTLGGSHAYGTNVPGSDVDVRGVTGDSKYDLLGFGTFEQVVEQSTDTTIYGFRKLVSLLINCNPNVIEMLGSKPDNYLMVSPEGQMLLDNKALFLSKKALYSFGGYANDQLRRLQMGLLQNDVNTDMKEEFALRSVQRVLSGPDLPCFSRGENVNGVLVKVIGEPSRTAAAFLVDVFCYDEMLRVTYLYYERLRKQSKSKTKIERK